MMAASGIYGGTGRKLTHATITLAGISSLVASLLSFVYVNSEEGFLINTH